MFALPMQQIAELSHHCQRQRTPPTPQPRVSTALAVRSSCRGTSSSAVHTTTTASLRLSHTTYDWRRVRSLGRDRVWSRAARPCALPCCRVRCAYCSPTSNCTPQLTVCGGWLPYTDFEEADLLSCLWRATSFDFDSKNFVRKAHTINDFFYNEAEKTFMKG